MARNFHRYKNFDVADYLNTKEEVSAYLSVVLEEGTADEFVQALGDVARSQGIAAISRETGLGRESLYKSLQAGKKPQFETILKVTRALGIKLQATA